MAVDAMNPLGGGKFKPYVKAIIEAERAPIRQIEGRKAKETEKLKLLQDFMGRVRKMTESLREMENYRKLREIKTDLGENGNLISIDLDKEVAEPGEYQLEVVQLAGRHSMISDGFEDPDAEIGVGYFWYQLPDGDTRSAYLDSDSNTLKDLVSAINKETDLGLQANLVNDGSGGDAPWRVIIAGKNTGMNEDITYPEFYFVDGDVRFTIDEERPAQSAIVKVNGFEILAPENKISNLIPGATISLKQAKEGQEFTVNITEDVQKIGGKIKAMVDNINAVLDFINKQNQLDDRSDTSRTLGGDGGLRTIEIQLRSLMQNALRVGGDPNDEDTGFYMRPSDLGMRFERSGQLSFSQETFQKKLAGNYQDVADFFVGKGGFVERVKNLTDGLVGMGSGTLLHRERGFRDRMRQMDDQIAQKEIHITRKEDALKQRFANLESTIAAMQGQQAFMFQALGATPQG